MIALQLNALQLGNQVILNFTKVLDAVVPITAEEEEEISEKETTDRAYWENRGSQLSLGLVDQCLEILREIDPTLTLTYNKYYIGLRQGNRANNFVIFKPKKNFLRAEIRYDDLDSLRDELKQKDIEVIGIDRRWGRLRIIINKGDAVTQRETLKKSFSASYRETAD